MTPDTIPDFLSSLTDDGRSANTVSTYRYNLEAFALWLKMPLSPDTFTARHINAYLAFLRENKRAKPSTVNLMRGALSAFAEYCVRQKLIGENPINHVKRVTEVKGAPKALSTEEMSRLMATAATYCPPRDGAIVYTLLTTGLRESELCGLLVKDVDLEKKQLTVYSGKGGKYRVVPLTAATCAVIQRYVDSEYLALKTKCPTTLERDYLFIGQNGPLLRNSIIRIVKTVGEKAGVKCHPHMLRHTYATHILKETGDLTAVSALLGHASIATTQIYTRPTQELLAERVQKALG